MTVISLATKLTAADVKANLMQLARACRALADDADNAFLRNCDPRAIQGGAIDEEANEWRDIRRQLCAIYNSIEE